VEIGAGFVGDTLRRTKRNSMAANAASNWPHNRLLLALPSRSLKRLMPELEQITCQRAQILMDADSALDHVFFPDSGVISVVAIYANGNIIEMATVGREGFSNVQAVFGAKRRRRQFVSDFSQRHGAQIGHYSSENFPS
jgi:hypothetical protein